MSTWIFETDSGRYSCIGQYNPLEKVLKVLYKFSKPENIVQASINSSLSLLLYVIKTSSNEGNNESVDDDKLSLYIPYVVEIKKQEKVEPYKILNEPKTKQTFVQFLWKKQQNLSAKLHQDKFILLIHEEGRYYNIFVD